MSLYMTNIDIESKFEEIIELTNRHNSLINVM